MRIGLEGTFYSAATTGHGQYVRALYQGLDSAVPHLTSVLLEPDATEGEQERAGRAVPTAKPPSIVSMVAAQRLWWEQVALAQAVRHADIDLMHLPFASTYLLSPVRPQQPVLLTLHDAISLINPVYANSLLLKAYLRIAHYAAYFADLVITCSEHSARDIARILHLPSDRIRVIPLAADECCQPLTSDDPRIIAVRAKYSLDSPFIYNVGGLDIRKNLPALLHGFAGVRSQLPVGTRLVISGAAHTDDPQRYPDLSALARQLDIAPWVTLTGRVSADEKIALMNAAAVYAYPSLYEGFGISPLEAMRCGTPVISSNRTSLPEVVGYGGILIDPEPAVLGAAMVQVLNSSEQAAELRQRALMKAAEFSWQRTILETAAVYAEIMNRRRSDNSHRR